MSLLTECVIRKIAAEEEINYKPLPPREPFQVNPNLSVAENMSEASRDDFIGAPQSTGPAYYGNVFRNTMRSAPELKQTIFEAVQPVAKTVPKIGKYLKALADRAYRVRESGTGPNGMAVVDENNAIATPENKAYMKQLGAPRKFDPSINSAERAAAISAAGRQMLANQSAKAE